MAGELLRPRVDRPHRVRRRHDVTPTRPSRYARPGRGIRTAARLRFRPPASPQCVAPVRFGNGCRYPGGRADRARQPNPMRRSSLLSRTAWCLLPLAAALVASGDSPRAQNPNCATRSTYQMGHATAVSNILQVDTGWQSGAATTTQQYGGGTPGSSRYSVGNVATSAAFGRLRAQAAGQAQNWNGNGTSLYLVQVAADHPIARFRDTVTVQSAGLPPGTPVQLALQVRLAGTAQVVGLQPLLGYGAQIRVDTQATGLGLGSSVATLTDTVGLASATVATTVGATLFLEGRLRVELQEIGVMGGQPASGSYTVDLEAVFDFQATTPGVSLLFCSGASYANLGAAVQSVGVGCGAAPPALAATLPQLGSTVALTTVGLPAGAPVFRGLVAAAPISVPIGVCTLQLDPALAALDFAGVAAAGGTLVTPLPIPNVSTFAGVDVTIQMLPLVPDGPFLGIAELSNAVALRLGL